MFRIIVQAVQRVVRLFITATILFCSLFVAGCVGTSSPNAQPSITISNQMVASPAGGLSFILSGSGFTPLGRVNIRLFNAPDYPPAVDFSNGAGLPTLEADSAGGFSRFRVSLDCNGDVQNPDPPSDISLWVVDAATNRLVIAIFKNQPFCGVFDVGVQEPHGGAVICPGPSSMCARH